MIITISPINYCYERRPWHREVSPRPASAPRCRSVGVCVRFLRNVVQNEVSLCQDRAGPSDRTGLSAGT